MEQPGFVLMLGISSFAQNLNIESQVRMLALGDSYTIGESVDESHRWPVQFADMLKSIGHSVKYLDIVAHTGWTTLDLKEGLKRPDH